MRSSAHTDAVLRGRAMAVAETLEPAQVEAVKRAAASL